MKLSLVLSLAYALQVSASRSCAADNCNRAITGTRNNVMSRLADCQSYFSATVTKTAKPSTITETTYSVIGNDAYETPLSKDKRITPAEVTPFAIPSYASAACTSKGLDIAGRYASACSCAGATHATTTVTVAALPTTTTKVKTVTHFKILATAAAVSSGKTQYLLPNLNTTSPSYQEFYLSSSLPKDGSAIYTLTTGYLTTFQDQITEQDPDATSEWVYTDPISVVEASGFIPINFIVDELSLAVTARNTQSGDAVLQVCYQGGGEVAYLNLAAKEGTPENNSGEPCYPVNLTAKPV